MGQENVSGRACLGQDAELCFVLATKLLRQQ